MTPGHSVEVWAASPRHLEPRGLPYGTTPSDRSPSSLPCCHARAHNLPAHQQDHHCQPDGAHHHRHQAGPASPGPQPAPSMQHHRHHHSRPSPASGTLTETPCKRSPPNGHLLHRPKGQLCQGDAWGLATPPAPWLFHLRSWTPCPSPNTWLLLVSSLCLGHSLSWWVYPVLSWQMQHKCHLPQEGFRWQGQGPLLGPAACECPSALALPTLYHPYPGEGSHQGRGLLKAGLAGW